MENQDKKKDDTDWQKWDEIDEQRKNLTIFGRNVSEMPCFRNSFLYGIGSGLGMGLGKFCQLIYNPIIYDDVIGTFMYTSRPAFSSHVAYGTFFSTTLFYWFYCR
jgi:cytochrome c oxidase assembly protein subunit 20